MTKFFKKIVSILLIFSMIFTIHVAAIFAADESLTDPDVEGKTGLSSIYDHMEFDAGSAGTIYINKFTGNLHVRRPEFTLGGERLPVSIELYYDLGNISDGANSPSSPYGIGWLTSYNRYISYENTSGNYRYRNEYGTWVRFINTGEMENGKEIWAEDVQYGIGEEGLTLYIPENITPTDYTSVEISDGVNLFNFDVQGRLTGITDGINEVSIIYSQSGSFYEIDYITDAVGRKYDFEYSYSNGTISSFSINCKDALGQTVLSAQKPLCEKYIFSSGNLSLVFSCGAQVARYSTVEKSETTTLCCSNIDGCGFAVSIASGVVISVAEKAAMFSQQEAVGKTTTFSWNNDVLSIENGGLLQKNTFNSVGKITEVELSYISSEPQNQGDPFYDIGITYGYVLDQDDVLRYDITDVISLIDEPESVTESAENNTELLDTSHENVLNIESEEESEVDPFEETEFTETIDQYGNTISSTVTNGSLNQTNNYTYTADGNYLLSETDVNGNTVSYNYNTLNGILQSVTDACGNETKYTYNALRELVNSSIDVTGLVDGTNMSCSYTYDSGRISTITYGDYVYSFTYDIWGNILTVTMNGNLLVSYDYGSKPYDRQAESLTYGNGNSVYYNYDQFDRVSSISTGSSNNIRFLYTYDDSGILIEISDLLTGQSISYSDTGYYITDISNNVLYSKQSTNDQNYSEQVLGTMLNSSLNTESLTKEKSIVFGTKQYDFSNVYDVLGRKIGKSQFGASISYGYQSTETNGDGNLITRYNYTNDNYGDSKRKFKLSLDYSYDNNGRIIGFSGESILEKEKEIPVNPPVNPPITPPIEIMSSNPHSTVLAQKSFHNSYAYDEAGQLVSFEDHRSNHYFRYSYDKSGNIRSKTDLATQTTYTYNYTNGIFTGYYDGTDSYIYTNNSAGDLLSITKNDSTVASLAWNDRRNLTTYTGMGFTANYVYDQEGRRIKKIVSKDNSVSETEYIWGDNGIAAVKSGSNILIVLYDEEGLPSGCILNGDVYSYVKNLQGDILYIISANGAISAQYTYDPWGNITISSTNKILRSLNPCTYRGYIYDSETGYYYLQSRYYDPEIGRFTNADDPEYLCYSVWQFVFLLL